MVEYLKDGINGYFVDDNKESIAITLKQITSLSDDKLKEMKLKAEITAKDFSVEAHVQKYKEIYKTILEN